MNIPNISCQIWMASPAHSSEDPDKIKTAITNIFPYSTIKDGNLSIIALSKELRSFERIYDVIRTKQLQKIYRRNLENNLKNDTTWFFLNKQAAFVEKVVICDESEESPLGPIQATITSSNIDEIIDWLVH